MMYRTRLLRTLLITVVAAFWAAGLVTAQPVFPNPPCITVTVNNTTVVPVQLNFTTVPPGIWPPFIVPAGAAINLPVPPPGVTVLGLASCLNPLVPFNPPPAAIPPCNATDWWINSIALPPTCRCFDICLDPINCTITIFGPIPPPCVNP